MIAQIFNALAKIVESYTGKLPSGKNVVTQSWGNNSIKPFSCKIGNETVKVLTPSMPARKASDIEASLTTGKFSSFKSEAKEYQKWLDRTDVLPDLELCYLLGYLFLSQLVGNGLSLIAGVRVSLLETILTSIPKNVEIEVKTMCNNGGSDIEVTYTRVNITALVTATSPRKDALDKADRKGEAVKESPQISSKLKERKLF